MRVTIVADDNVVHVDGRPLTVDLSALDPEIHAVQWYGNRGEVEYRALTCDHCGSVRRKPNLPITDLSPYQRHVDDHALAAASANAAAAVSRANVQVTDQAPVHVIAD